MLLSYSIQSAAYQPSEGNVSAFLGPFLYKTDFKDTSTGASSPALGGLGLIVVGDVDDKGSLEIGLFQMNKVFLREQSGQYISEQTAVAHVSMGYRRYFSDTFSGSMAFYSAYSMGDPVVIHSDFAPGTAIDTSARDTTEYGLDLALQAQLWSQGAFAVDVDTRYSWSVTNKPNENADHYGVLLGVRYLYQEK